MLIKHKKIRKIALLFLLINLINNHYLNGQISSVNNYRTKTERTIVDNREFFISPDRRKMLVKGHKPTLFVPSSTIIKITTINKGIKEEYKIFEISYSRKEAISIVWQNNQEVLIRYLFKDKRLVSKKTEKIIIGNEMIIIKYEDFKKRNQFDSAFCLRITEGNKNYSKDSWENSVVDDMIQNYRKDELYNTISGSTIYASCVVDKLFRGREKISIEYLSAKALRKTLTNEELFSNLSSKDLGIKYNSFLALVERNHPQTFEVLNTFLGNRKKLWVKGSHIKIETTFEKQCIKLVVEKYLTDSYGMPLDTMHAFFPFRLDLMKKNSKFGKFNLEADYIKMLYRKLYSVQREKLSLY